MSEHDLDRMEKACADGDLGAFTRYVHTSSVLSLCRDVRAKDAEIAKLRNIMRRLVGGNILWGAGNDEFARECYEAAGLTVKETPAKGDTP